MIAHKPIAALLLSTALTLSACGLTYHSPSVQEAAGDVAVRIMPITGESVTIANKSPYAPRPIPAAFYQTAQGGTSTVVGTGAVPAPPDVPTKAPDKLELRVPPEPPQSPYRIGVGDVLLLAVRDTTSTVEQLSGLLAAQNNRQGYTVRDDGTIALPEIGNVDVSGLTLQEAEEVLLKALVSKAVNTNFSLEVSEFNSKRVAIGGAVGAARLVPIALTPLKLGEALTVAGGIVVADTEFASIRIYRDGTLYQIPVEDFLTRPNLRNLRLADGDAIFVDTTYDLERAQRYYEQQISILNLRRSARTQALTEMETEISLRRAVLEEKRSNFTSRLELGAEKRDYVYLTGEVGEQARIPLAYGQTTMLADVLYGGGGFPTATGDPSHIYVLRASTNANEFGAVTAWHLDARNAAKLTIATRFQMRPSDVVFIREQPITAWGRALQQLFPTILQVGASGITD